MAVRKLGRNVYSIGPWSTYSQNRLLITKIACILNKIFKQTFFDFQVIEKFIRFAYRQRYDGQNMTYEASTFLYAIAVAVFALGGMAGGFVGGWMANNFGRYKVNFFLTRI